MTLKTPLPEKIKAKILRGDEGNLVMHTIVTQNEIIDYLAELTVAVENLERLAYPVRVETTFTNVGTTPSLKETLLLEINKLVMYRGQSEYSFIALSDVKDIINRLIP